VKDTDNLRPIRNDAEARAVERALYEIKHVIAGQDEMLERTFVCLLTGGHLLIEGVPGLAKTLTIKTVADVLGGTFQRVQFTPDLVPSDLVGTRIYRTRDDAFDTELGPMFCNFLLADEINRAPAKVQSALLEVMQERQVTLGKETHPVPSPFLVMATQNPIESEGTYPLPEAQIDRFMLKILIGYPTHDEELTIVQRQLTAPPELRETLTIKTTAAVLGGTFRRVQFTPDLVPSDLVGTRIYRPDTGGFDTEEGPVFCNFLLADEINRAPAKVQSALLEVMQERQVTIGHDTHLVPDPFLVMATQNPIETEGTYPLPEAQVDRFMMKVLVDYPTDEEEYVIVERVTGPAVHVTAVASTEQLAALQHECRRVYVDPSLVQYAVKLVSATRNPDKHGLKDLRRFSTFGASPRATINLTEGARALAMLRGRTYALPEDMSDLVPDVLRHRLVLSYEALSEGLSSDQVVQKIMAKIPAPAKPLEHEKLAA